MFSGKFNNCYGIRAFEMPKIDFGLCNKALIYAPNGMMKSSFSKVFEDISNGRPTIDRIFPDDPTSYCIHYNDQEFSYIGPDGAPPKAAENVYVINSFAEKFEFTKDTVGILLADEQTRTSYNQLSAAFSGEVRQISDRLRQLTGLTKPKIKETLIADLELPSNADWTDIMEQIRLLLPQYEKQPFMEDTAYIDLFNDKALAIYKKPEFRKSIASYIKSLGELLSNSTILSTNFTDRSAEALGKAFAGNDLFKANHAIRLRDGTEITSLAQWNAIVKAQLDTIYQDPALATEFEKLKKLLTGNNEGSRVRDIIMAHRELVSLLQDIPALKKQVWLHCFQNLDRPFEDYYANTTQYTAEIRSLYERAEEQSQRWQEVVTQFNRRFRVPFKVKINNKANFLLKDEAPNLSFVYSRGTGSNLEQADLRQNDLMGSLSMGEKRALYLLDILFDLERIRQQAGTDGKRALIIADDVADSFDYKNKYAIIEYLDDLAKHPHIDLLVLTHNFDFYRTLLMRLGVERKNCYSVQKEPDGTLKMTEFAYQGDFFKNVIVSKIKSSSINSDYMKKLLIASIPFYRNLFEYSGNREDYLKLTCFLHLKTDPVDTESATLADLWSIISGFLGGKPFNGRNENYSTALQRIALQLAGTRTDAVNLENTLLIAIAVRQAAEKFLRRRIQEKGETCVVVSKDQTRAWYNQALPYLSDTERGILDEVNLVTPESIHLNSFMFEPLVDISDWALKDLYKRVIDL